MENRRRHTLVALPSTLVTIVVLVVVILCSSVDGFGGIHGIVGSVRKGSSIALGVSEEDSMTTTTTTTTDSMTVTFDAEGNPRFPIERTKEEWKELLTSDQYYILRKEGTETPGASALNQISVEKNGSADDGTFLCAGCDIPLFRASDKYDSGTGWPSFSKPVTNSAVFLQTDYKMVVPRTECVCTKCGGHLGHVFEDGPEPTGQRYCMNGAAMTFSRDSEDPELAETTARIAEEDPYKLAPQQALPSILINVLIGGLFFNSFLSSGKSTPIEYLTLLAATYYGFLAAKSISKILG